MGGAMGVATAVVDDGSAGGGVSLLQPQSPNAATSAVTALRNAVRLPTSRANSAHQFAEGE